VPEVQLFFLQVVSHSQQLNRGIFKKRLIGLKEKLARDTKAVEDYTT